MSDDGLNMYQYAVSKRRKDRLGVNRLPEIREVVDPKPLTGWVHGKRATDIEERFARGLMRMNLDFWFQVPFATRLSIPGRKRVVDFIVENGFRYPVEVDGPRWHSEGEDEVREQLLNEVFRAIAYMPLQRVKWWRLESQAMAKRVVSQMFG